MNKLDLSQPSSRILPALLRAQASQNGEQIFLRTEHSSLTFAQVDERSNRLANALRERGIQAGQNVGIFLENGLEFVVIAMAVNKLQAIWVPINTDYKGEWLLGTLTDSQPEIIFTQSELWQRNLETLQSAADRLQHLRVVFIDEVSATNNTKSGGASDLSWPTMMEGDPTPINFDDACYGDTCAILWTSGTTGKSKGVQLSHNNWIRPIVDGTCLFYNSQAGDVIMNVLPMYHAAAWNTAILRALIEGISVVIEPRFSVTSFWERIARFNVTQTFTLGAMHMFLWNAPESPDDADNSLRKLQAVPMPLEIKSKFEQRFGVEVLGNGFGQSECMLVITEAGQSKQAPPYSMGFAAHDLEIKLFDDNDQEVPLGDSGEIRFKPLAPHIVCNGYFNNPEASESVWKDGWFCTGDMARQDESGAYFFVDRKKDAVRFAGRNISTLEVESVVRKFPGISDVAAFGIPSQEMAAEDELKLNIVLNDFDTTEDGDKIDQKAQEIARFINHNAPYYFVPRYIEFVAKLPYTPTNKVQKFKLRDAGINAAAWDRKASDFKVSR